MEQKYNEDLIMPNSTDNVALSLPKPPCHKCGRLPCRCRLPPPPPVLRPVPLLEDGEVPDNNASN